VSDVPSIANARSGRGWVERARGSAARRGPAAAPAETDMTRDDRPQPPAAPTYYFGREERGRPCSKESNVPPGLWRVRVQHPARGPTAGDQGAQRGRGGGGSSSGEQAATVWAQCGPCEGQQHVVLGLPGPNQGGHEGLQVLQAPLGLGSKQRRKPGHGAVPNHTRPHQTKTYAHAHVPHGVSRANPGPNQRVRACGQVQSSGSGGQRCEQWQLPRLQKDGRAGGGGGGGDG
jgi:hypothetical protein